MRIQELLERLPHAEWCIREVCDCGVDELKIHIKALMAEVIELRTQLAALREVK